MYREQRILRYFDLIEDVHHHCCLIEASKQPPLQVTDVRFSQRRARADEVFTSFPKFQRVSSVFSSALEETSHNTFCRQASYQTQQIYS